MGRRGCLGRLFWLPMALLGGQRSRPALPQRGLDPAEREALQAARQAAAAISQRLLATGRDVDPMVLDQVGGSAQALGDAVDRMGRQLAEARDWLSRNDPDRLNRELTELELTDGAGVGARATAMRLLRDKARKAAMVQAELPRMSAQLRALAAELGSLEASMTLDALRADATQTIQDAERQRAEAERALAAWEATVKELRALS